MSSRLPRTRALALAALAVTTACASARAPRSAAIGPEAAGVAVPAFRPVDGDPSREIWSVRANFHEVVAFLDSLSARLPAACSTRLSLRFAEVRDGRVLIDSEGTVLLARNGADCVGWRPLVAALDGIATTIPQRMWAREMLQDGDRLEIRGLLRGSEAEVGAFAGALSTLEPVREAQVASLRPADESGVPVIEFQLALWFRDGS